MTTSGAGSSGLPVAFKVVVIAGPDEGCEAALDSSLEIGGAPPCQLRLTDPAVSRRHLAITVLDRRIVVRDLASRNGTFLGGVRIREAEVPVGAVLKLGHSAVSVQPRWHVREVAPSAQRCFGEVLGESVAMREVFAVLERVAPTDVTVLLEGETGTGKELIARSIHKASTRASKPYVVFDCGAVPAELAQSELFGHKRGSFSGATADREGSFRRAHGGTIFLDEIGELPLELQPKLLRVLESGEIRPVGSDQMRQVDVRVVAATNRDLQAEARRGRFRSDLLYRLEVVKLHIAPLRQRPEDVPLLAARLLAGKLPPGDEVGGESLKRLVGYSWPGNVRELRNTLTRALALASPPGRPAAPFAKLVFNLGPLAAAPVTLGREFPGVSSPAPYKQAKEQLLFEFHRAYVTALLERHGGNVQQAASAAGLSRKHLYELMKRLDVGTEGER
ncbi:MAG: sigma 54-dependent Fis family transcriptional regulator [Deltaproteobacteria bacterium]|nr:sigma 54-dependent Fis family transcriptional regulator [Deltaproteobacteria bacterium]